MCLEGASRCRPEKSLAPPVVGAACNLDVAVITVELLRGSSQRQFTAEVHSARVRPTGLALPCSSCSARASSPRPQGRCRTCESVTTRVKPWSGQLERDVSLPLGYSQCRTATQSSPPAHERLTQRA